ncbi:Autocrine proliferation repressor protein A [Holothuria leucospilota]|uniref:Autocrine proliferation repressor protein A n=1 Tax=Holothuria leucospilota TaxID=206669 RepID=A0A9Q1C2R8_HOLLE|nr:Autocrine proliferation repressor protein A [Holothuria leucospilota]
MSKPSNKNIFWIVVIGFLVVTLTALVATWVSMSTRIDKEVDANEPKAADSFLQEYVQIRDPEYGYKLLPEYTMRNRDESYTAFVLNMTSHQWLSADKVSRTLWWHFMTVIIPDEIVYPDIGCIYLTGGSNHHDPQDPTTDVELRLVTATATRLGIVCALQRQVPNGKFKFFDDPEKEYRGGDDLIAYTIKYFMNGHTDDPEALLLVPMTKSAVRGMDTITNFADHRINKFFVLGASKRGWAAWLTAAVDKRVIAVAPLVLDFLNMIPNFAHHYRSLNGWAWAMKDYWYHNVTVLLNHPDIYLATNIIDPFSYRALLTMPKYVVTGSMDEFFLPDDSHYYYSEMLGDTYLRIHQNTDHILIGRYQEIVDELVGFALSVFEGEKFPKLTWERTEGSGKGFITVTTDRKPFNITAWKADTATDTSRDFRILVARTPNTTDVKPQRTLYRDIGVGNPEENVYQAVVEIPNKGWSCFFIEMMFEAPKGQYVAFTTEVNIVPDTFPSEDCEGWECKGTLV